MHSRLIAAALIVAAAGASACGKRGDPLPPIRPVPGRLTDLVARRIDGRVELRFTVPATNNDGTTPSAIDRIEVYRTMTTADATAPSAVMLINRKNLIGQITVKRPPPPEAQTQTTPPAPPSGAPAPSAKPAAPAEPPGPAPGELAVFTDTTPVDQWPASAVRHYILLGWAGRQQQRSTRLDVVMDAQTPPKPVEKLAAQFDASSIKVTWIGPPLLFLPVQRAGSPLPPGFLPPAPRVAANELPIVTMPKASAIAVVPPAPPGRTGQTTTAQPPGRPAEPPSRTTEPPIPPSRTGTGATTTTPPPGTAPLTRVDPSGTGMFPPTGLAPGAVAPGTMPGLTPGMGAGAVSIAVGPVRAYRVTEVDESGHELAPGAPLPATIPQPLLTLPVVFDKTRCFVVRTVDTAGSVIMESPASAPVCVTPKDTFPPPAPSELRAFPGQTGVVLTWTGVEAPDLAGYIVLRGEGAGENMQPLNASPMSETTYADTTTRAGVTYVYAVIAVDSSPQHNPSARSNTQTIVAR